MSIESNITLLAQAIGTDIKGLVPKVQTPIYADSLTNNTYTATLADIGKTFLWNGTADITFVVPSSLPDGFSMKVFQFDAGNITLDSGGRQMFANGTATGLKAQGSSMTILTATLLIGGVTPVRILFVSYDSPLPTLWSQGTSDITLTSSTMTNLPSTTVTLDANSVYDVDLRLMYTAVNTSVGLKVGFANLTGGASAQIDYRIAFTNASGTAPWRTGFLYGSTALASGSAVVGVAAVKLHASMVGRITTGSSPVVLTPQVGLSANSTTNTITIAASDVSMVCKKVL